MTNSLDNLAHVVTNLPALSVDATGAAAPLPSTGNPTIDAIITVLVPVLVTGLKKLCAAKGFRIPKAVWPITTPFLGLLIGQLLCWLLSVEASVFDLAKAGALAVFVREALDQLWKTRKSSQPKAPEPE